MPTRVQDLEEITEFISDTDKVLIIKPTSQGLTQIINLKKYETVGSSSNNNSN